jgi:hypothetical protein
VKGSAESNISRVLGEDAFVNYIIADNLVALTIVRA